MPNAIEATHAVEKRQIQKCQGIIMKTLSLGGLRTRFNGENLSRVKRSLRFPSYPGLDNFSFISVQTLASRLHEIQKVG